MVNVSLAALVMVSSFSRVIPPEPLTSIPVVAVKLSDVTEVAPVTTPASTFTVPSNTTAEPDAGIIFIAPVDVLSVTAASPWFISSAATVPAVTLNSADPSTAGNFPRLSNWTICPEPVPTSTDKNTRPLSPPPGNPVPAFIPTTSVSPING